MFLSDQDGEFISFVLYLKEHDIDFRHPYPHTHRQNGKTQRKHTHVVEMGLVLLSQARMPINFWWEVFQASVFLINRLPTLVLNQKSSFQMLFGHKPNYMFLKVFGCARYHFLRSYNRHKTDFHSQRCVVLGYIPIHKGYICFKFIWEGVHFNKCQISACASPNFQQVLFLNSQFTLEQQCPDRVILDCSSSYSLVKNSHLEFLNLSPVPSKKVTQFNSLYLDLHYFLNLTQMVLVHRLSLPQLITFISLYKPLLLVILIPLSTQRRCCLCLKIRQYIKILQQ